MLGYRTLNEIGLAKGLEATLSDSKRKYGDKVNALLSAWEHVTNFIPAATPEGTQSLIEWVHKHTLKLVLRGEWPKLSPATKTHLCVTLQRCATHLVQHSAAPMCIALIALVNNPWARPALDSILNGQPDSENEDEFCCSEKGELLTMRLKILCEDRCEDIAINLAAACVRSLRRSDRLRTVSDPQHVNFMLDVYIVLLYKLKRMQDILAQLKLMDLHNALELVQRLSGEKPTKYGTARVWRNSVKAAELVAQYLVTAGMVRPVAETGANVLEKILNSWAMLHTKLKDISSTLPGMIRKLIEPAESAQHMYIFCAVLLKHFGDSVKPLVIELYIRALTADMNELENQKAKADRDKVRETAERLGAQFLKLAEVVDSEIGIARECVLTAFSLHPTRACYERVLEMAIACGKAKQGEGVVVVTTKDAACDDKKRSSSSVGKFDFLKSPANEEKPPKDCNGENGVMSPLCFRCGDYEATKKSVDRSLDALVLINGDVVTGSANYDEKSVPNHMLDAEKLGLTPQLCDDLSVVLSSPRYHMLSWLLDWKELHTLCERYLVNAEEMGGNAATHKELKYLNIDYSQFKDWPSEDENAKDVFFGIEKGYEQWVDLPSDSSEQFGSFQPAGGYKRNTTRRSLDDTTTTDSDSGSIMRVRRTGPTGRQRKPHRLESSESDYESAERETKGFRNSASSDEDTNTQDTSSLGSDGFRRDKQSCAAGVAIEVAPKRDKSSHFHMLVNENASGSDVSSNDMITLFAVDENKRETIKGSSYTAAAPLIITEKRSDPAVLKSLRMFRPQNAKKPSRMAQIMQKNLLKKDQSGSVAEATSVAKFAPMLSTLNLNPKIVLTRTDERLAPSSNNNNTKKPQLSPVDISSELINIQKSLPFSPSKNYHKRKASPKPRSRKSPKSLGKSLDILAKAVRDSEILAKSVPGLNSLDMIVPPRVAPTINVVQLSRNIPQSPSSGSGNTPPRNRTSSLAGSIQLPGTPSSSGHDSGVGLSPAGQTPPPRSASGLHELGDEANQPPDNSPGSSSNNATTHEPPDSPREIVAAPAKSPRPTSGEQLQIVCKPDGTYQLASINPAASQRGALLTLHNLEDEARNFKANPSSSSAQNTGLPKFQQAFRKAMYTLSSETEGQKTGNLSKAVQTSVPQASPVRPANTAARQILNIVQTSSASTGQTITQLVQATNPGVIYTHKIPVTISTNNPGQISIVPPIANSRTPLVKLNIIRAGAPLRQQHIAEAIQVALTAPRAAHQRNPESLVNPGIDPPNQVSSTTLEQLREFESVLEQVKERSTIQPHSASSTTTVETQTTCQPALKQPVSALAQQLLVPAQSPPSAEFPSNGGTSAYHQPEAFAQKVSLSYAGSAAAPQKVAGSPVVVATSYCAPAASPALSVCSQSSLSPCVTPSLPKTAAPSPKSAKKLVPKNNAKTSSSSNTTTTSAAAAAATATAPNNAPAKSSPIPKPQQKPQEDEQTAQRIYTILAEYAEQLRNSPDLNNKPAPRRRSNPPTNPSQSSKRKKPSSKAKPSGASELSPDDLGRTMGSEDSSGGLVQVQDSPGIANAQEDAVDEARTNEDETVTDLKRRSLLFTEPGAGTRTVIVQEAVQTGSEALVAGKIGGTAVLMPTNYILPMNIVKGGQQFTIVSSNSKLLVPSAVRTSGTAGVSNTLVLQSILNSGKIISQPGQVKQVKLPALQSLSGQGVSILPQNQFPETRENNNGGGGSEAAPEHETVIKASTIGLLQRNEATESQRICGVIASNPNLGIQGAARLFNSTIAKMTTIATTTSASSQQEKKLGRDHVPGDKPVTLQGQTIALAFAAQSNVTLVNNGQQSRQQQAAHHQLQLKETNEAATEITSDDKLIPPKTVKRKIDEANNVVVTNNSIVSPCIVASLQSIVKNDAGSTLKETTATSTTTTTTTTTTKTTAATTISIENAAYLGTSDEAGNTETTELRDQPEVTLEAKVGNGIMCANARLQEAWEPERKSSPDTPWRYVPASATSEIEPLKSYVRDPENCEVHGVLQLATKNVQTNQIYQKKYHLEAYAQYSARNTGRNPRTDTLQQKMERKAAAIERELRLQKSLSEECEDLGVDEPSTSDLFPEADLLFDANHSPTYDQDATCSNSSATTRLYNAATYYHRPLDSSSGDASPLSNDYKMADRRKTASRTRAIRDSAKRAKKMDDDAESPAKRLSLENYDDGDDDDEDDDDDDEDLEDDETSGLGKDLRGNVAPALPVVVTGNSNSIAGPLLTAHKYTYTNRKRASRNLRNDYLAWESPSTGTPSDEDEASADENRGNGLLDETKTCSIAKKLDKLTTNPRVVLNRAEKTTKERSPDEASDEDAINDCPARRSSLRGHVKKGCVCCNGSPERPRKKNPLVGTRPNEHRTKKKITAKFVPKKR